MGQIEDIRKRLAEHPENVLDQFALAKLLMDSGKTEEAVKAFQRLIEIKSDYLMAHVHLGDLLIRLGQTEEAKPVLERARELAIEQNHDGPREDVEMMLEGV